MAKKDILGLDGLRSFAIIAITLYHLFPVHFKGGYFGVIIFFSLTGFLTVVSTENKRRRNEFCISAYYFTRIKRIYPSLIFVVLLPIVVYAFLTVYDFSNLNF